MGLAMRDLLFGVPCVASLVISAFVLVVSGLAASYVPSDGLCP
jgi:hypothetical protein